MNLARDIDEATSSPTAAKLSALAVAARKVEAQTEMVESGVHLRLPALLLSQCGCGMSHRCQQCCSDWRQMQAQCSRLLGNLSYLQANKTAVVQAGGLDALLVAIRGALQTVGLTPVAGRQGELALEASAALLLEATAALANLASGGATRRKCEDLDCEAVPLLLRCLRLWEPSAQLSGEQPPQEQSAASAGAGRRPPLWKERNSVAVESARAPRFGSNCRRYGGAGPRPDLLHTPLSTRPAAAQARSPISPSVRLCTRGCSSAEPSRRCSS